jgi:hypothetical protein
VAVDDRVFQVSDLAGSKRREFVDLAKRGNARLRDIDGTPLVMLREAGLVQLEELSEALVGYLSLETALDRKRDDRQPTDYGNLAWASTLDERDLVELRDDLRAALAVAASQRDTAPVDNLLRDWRYTALDLADPRSGPILRDDYTDDDFVEAPRPVLHAPPG